LHEPQIHDNAVKRRGRAEKEATDAEISARAAELAHRDYRSARFSEAASPQAASDRSNGAQDGEAAADAPAAKRRRVDGDSNAGWLRFVTLPRSTVFAKELVPPRQLHT